MRSGHCTQQKKLWDISSSCKDMILLETSTNVNSYDVFPKTNELLTNSWIGNHSSLIVNIIV